MVYVFDQQLDVFGGAHDIAPAHETQRLFVAPRTLKGQTSLGDVCRSCEGLGYTRPFACTGSAEQRPCHACQGNPYGR